MNKHGQWCYTYLLGWRDHDVWYYGYRAANKVEPENDLPFYLSSSEEVYDYIRVHGYPDVERVHKLFHTKDEAKKHETKFIKKVDAVRSSRWLNKHDGGENWGVARYFSEEHKRKISEAKTGFKFSDETRRQMSESAKERFQTEEGQFHRKKLAESKKGKPAHNRGVPMSDEQRKKVSESVLAGYVNGRVHPKKGKPVSEETRQKLGTLRRGKTNSEEHNKKNSQRVWLWHYLGRPKGGIKNICMDAITKDQRDAIESHLAMSIESVLG